MTVAGLVSLIATHAAVAGALALIVALLALALRHEAAAHALWVVVLAKLLTPPVFELAVLPSRADGVVAPRQVRETVAGADRLEVAFPVSSPRPAAEAPRSHLALGVLLILAGGSLSVAVLTWWRRRRFQRLLGASAPGPERLRLRLSRLASRLGLKRAPRLRIVPGRLSPMLWPGLEGVELILPRDLLGLLSERELDAVLIHELAHLRRRDHWVRLLELTATILFWWHPAVWWARRRIRRLEERSCDAWVVHMMPGQARVYAEALLKTMEFLAGRRSPLPAAATGIEACNDMKERLTMILTQRTSRILAPWHRWLLAALAAALLIVVPTRAEREDAAALEAYKAREASYREEALELERRGVELEKQLHELDAARRQLDYDREMLQRDAELSKLEKKALELESAGETLEARLHRERREAIKKENELVRQRHELELRAIEERAPLELELREKMLRIKEHELQEQHERAEALRHEARAEKQHLDELRREAEQHHLRLRQAQAEHHVDLLERRRQALEEAGRGDEAARLEKELAYLKAESLAARQHRGWADEKLELEKQMAQAREQLLALEGQAAGNMARELEAKLHALELEGETRWLKLSEAQKHYRAAQIMAQVEELERRAGAEPGKRQELLRDLEALKRELSELDNSPR